MLVTFDATKLKGVLAMEMPFRENADCEYRITTILTALALAALTPWGVDAAPGDLDPTFGTSGVVVADPSPGNDAVNAMALQPDGKILTAGYVENGSDKDFALARYLPDGSVDTDFGTGGLATLSLGFGDDIATALALDAEGRIVASGYGSDGVNWRFIVARYEEDGSPDSTFGTNGFVTTFFGSQSSGSQSYGVAIQSDGKILAAGRGGSGGGGQPERVAISRYLPNGELDTGFGDNGEVVTDIAPGSDVVYALLIQPDGKIIAVGTANVQTFVLARYLADGSLDPDFGEAGTVATDVGPNLEQALGAALQPDGKIVVVGHVQFSDVALARFELDGELDSEFGENGIAIKDVSGDDGNDTGHAVLVQVDGRIVVAGASRESAFLARYDPDGSLDKTFADDGIRLVAYTGGSNAANALAQQPDGKILTAGRAGTTFQNIALSRHEGSVFLRCEGSCFSEFADEDGQQNLGRYVKKVLADIRRCTKSGPKSCPCDMARSDAAAAKLDMSASCAGVVQCRIERLFHVAVPGSWDSSERCFDGPKPSRCERARIAQLRRLSARTVSRASKQQFERLPSDLRSCAARLRRKCGEEDTFAELVCVAASNLRQETALPIPCHEDSTVYDESALQQARDNARDLLGIEIDTTTGSRFADYSALLIKAAEELGCYIPTSDIVSLLEETQPRETASRRGLLTSLVLDCALEVSEVQYCGPGDSNVNSYLKLWCPGRCLREVCREHDDCYGGLANDSCVDTTLCMWSELTAGCDQTFFDAYNDCLFTLTKCGVVCQLTGIIATGITLGQVFNDECTHGGASDCSQQCNGSGCCVFRDDDCSVCDPGSLHDCTTGDPGICAAGTRTCNEQGTAYGPCVADQSAQTENVASGTCNNALDDDCDGATDLADAGCQACSPGSTQACSTGLAGICADGMQTCDGEGMSYGSCVPNQSAQTESELAGTCGNGLDDDCDTLADCNDPDCASVTACEPEICDGLDNDGNGVVDDGYDDGNDCWVSIYRFKPPSHENRAYNSATSPPAQSSGYSYEAFNFILHREQVPNTFLLRQCSALNSDFILVPDGSSDHQDLEAAEYDCSVALGYARDPNAPALNSPWGGACPVYRAAGSSGLGGWHLFTLGDDTFADLDPEPPARFGAFDGDLRTCFSGAPLGF